MVWLGNLKISSKLFGSFSIIVALMLGVGILSLLKLGSLKTDIEIITKDNYPKTKWANEISAGVLQAEISLRNAVLADNHDEIANELSIINDGAKRVAERIELFKKNINTEKGKELFQKYLDARSKYREELVKVIALLKEGKQQDAREALRRLAPLRELYVNSLLDMIKYQDESMGATGQEAEDNYTLARNIIIVAILVAISLSLFLAIIITGSIVKPLNKAVSTAERVADGDLTVEIEANSSDETGTLLKAIKHMANKLRKMMSDIKQASASMASGSEQLSASSEEITRSMSSQSARASQIATSAEEMSQTVIDIAKNSANIATAATDTASIAGQGADIVNKSVDESKAIATTVDNSVRVMQTLGDRSKQIGEIIAVINDIADQTNLLALNAAIEAARAGEQGRGFAVVADEVRKLAERTSKATSEISGMIGSMQSEVDHAVQAMDETSKKVEVGLKYSQNAGEQLSNIVSSATSLKGMVQQIATATEEMSTTSEAISGDIHEIANGSSEISSGATQIARSSTELARLAGDLKVIVEQFKV
ncbi:MAG: methyl-accepting chemotaxis protein [Dissulfurispiraceae bacterium]